MATRMAQAAGCTALIAMMVACADSSAETKATDRSASETTQANTANADNAAPTQRLVHVARLETPKANDEFTKNSEIMQARIKHLASLNAQAAGETDDTRKTAMQSEMAMLQEKIQTDNQRMIDAYRYSLTHRYVRDIEQATVYLVLSDDEVAAIKAKAAADGNPAPASLASNQLSICTLPNRDAARAFQRDVATLQAERTKAMQVQQELDAAETSEDRAYAQGQLDQVLQQVNTLNKAMVGAYGFSLNRNYVLQIDKSSLYVWVNEDEVQPDSTAAVAQPGG